MERDQCQNSRSICLTYHILVIVSVKGRISSKLKTEIGSLSCSLCFFLSDCHIVALMLCKSMQWLCHGCTERCNDFFMVVQNLKRRWLLFSFWKNLESTSPSKTKCNWMSGHYSWNLFHKVFLHILRHEQHVRPSRPNLICKSGVSVLVWRCIVFFFTEFERLDKEKLEMMSHWKKFDARYKFTQQYSWMVLPASCPYS
jgi:hypothetical protein